MRLVRATPAVLLTLSIGLLSAGCTLYKSSDRDVFNSRAHENPAPRSLTPHFQTCAALTPEESGEAMTITNGDGFSEVAITQHVTNEVSVSCRLVFQKPFTENELLTSSRAAIEAYVSTTQPED